MSTIRRQSIISSAIVYLGFALGLLNTYLFTMQGGLTKEQYGITGTFIAFASIMFSFASMGMHAFVGKFFPYYDHHLPQKKNDQLTLALTVCCLGFLPVILFGVLFKNVLVDKIFNNSPELLRYYYWTFPFGFGYTLFMILEAYAWQKRNAVLSNFLKEVVFRLALTILIALAALGLITDFDVFIAIYAFFYLLISLYLLIYLVVKKKFFFNFSISKVTRRFKKKIVVLVSFFWSAGLVFNIASVFDTIVIAAVLPNGMAALAPFLLAQNISSLIQAPQRAVVSSAIGPLSLAWKEKDYAKINRIYHRSSINQLVFSVAMFSLIWLNFEDGIYTFRLQPAYIAAKWAFFFIGLYKIIDMGTGLNAQIIGTSNYWRFEFMTGMILLATMLPLNWALTRHFNIVGPAISNLVGFTIYNGIRYVFLWKRFRMQPFTNKTLYTILLGAACFAVTYFLFDEQRGIEWMVLRSAVFCILFAAGTISLRLSPDVMPVWQTVKKRLGIG